MKILIVGSGGREHALGAAISKSPQVSRIYYTGHNPGLDQVATAVDMDPLATRDLARWAAAQCIDLTVVGPEAPLAAGIVDHFEEEGLLIFGPSQRAALIEGSKVFAKGFMERHHIPTAQYIVCNSAEEARAAVASMGAPLVVKADGLAAGKGVTVCFTLEEAEQAIHDIMVQRVFGASGNQVVIEQFLQGEEATLLAFIDGDHIRLMPAAQDHKAIYEGDVGPNTGGMGAYSPAPVITSAVQDDIVRRIIQPTVAGLKAEGRPYRGVLYTGVIITESGPKVIEFNCRFGDPETQAILPRLQSDLVDVLAATAKGNVADVDIRWDHRPCVSVVLASGGYPGQFKTGMRISGLSKAASVVDDLVFVAGARRDGNDIVTAGGRVLSVSALGDTLDEAVTRVYEAVGHIRFDGMTYRRDIAHRALSRSVS